LIVAEDQRHYNLWSYWHADRRAGRPRPADLIEPVLWQRVRALQWLHGIDPWDEVRGDA
jgi:hypothetical protein